MLFKFFAAYIHSKLSLVCKLSLTAVIDGSLNMFFFNNEIKEKCENEKGNILQEKGFLQERE